MPQVPPHVVSGDLGESIAQIAFQRIGWAPPVKIRQDVGDDFITFARDGVVADQPDNLHDLSSPVLFQVKSSRKKYKEPRKEHKGEPGWWFAEPDADHFDHWLKFGLPYLLVLVDLAGETAYWTHVRSSAVISTGKGRKIFVPERQRVDIDHLADLNEVAATRRTFDLEGQAWSGRFDDLTPSERLRNALLLPRIVAPHPNRTPQTLEYEQAIALIMRGRAFELGRFAQDGHLPLRADWIEHDKWGWRFTHALEKVVAGGLPSELDGLAANAPSPFERDACRAVHAAALHSAGRTQEAIDRLGVEDDTVPTDRGWLLTHRAHLLLDVDEPDHAAAAGQDALFALTSMGGDLSASALRGSSAAIVYAVAGYDEAGLEHIITTQDNAASWWRTNDVASALGRDLEDRFKGWASDTSLTVRSQTAQRDLNSAIWNAAFSASWPTWRYLTVQFARIVLTRTRDPEAIAFGLGRLLVTGSKSDMNDAAATLWRNGPIAALAPAVEQTARDPWLKRMEASALALLARAGDLLSAADADDAVGRIIDLVKNDGPIRRIGGSWASRWSDLEQALPRLLSAASASSHHSVAAFIADQFNHDEGTAASCVRIGSALNVEGLSPAERTALRDAAERRSDHYEIDLLQHLGNYDAQAVARLETLAAGPDLRAVRALLALGSATEERWSALGAGAAKTVRKMLKDAAGTNGSFSYAMYVNDNLKDLTLAALHTRDARRWKLVTDALAAGTLQASDVTATIELLAGNFSDLPRHVQRKLAEIAPNLAAAKPIFSSPNSFMGAATALRVAAGAVDDAKLHHALLRLRATDPAYFVRLLSLWDNPQADAYLIAATSDPFPQVRAQAGYALLERCKRQRKESIVQEADVISVALELSDGVSMADAVAQGVATWDTPELDAIRQQLGRHPSALVRSRLHLAT